MSAVDLINYLRLDGPHDQVGIITASEEDAPPRETSSLVRRETLRMMEMFLLRQI